MPSTSGRAISSQPFKVESIQSLLLNAELSPIGRGGKTVASFSHKSAIFIASWIAVKSEIETGSSPWAERNFFEISLINSRESDAGDLCPERAEIKPWRLSPIDENC